MEDGGYEPKLEAKNTFNAASRQDSNGIPTAVLSLERTIRFSLDI